MLRTRLATPAAPQTRTAAPAATRPRARRPRAWTRLAAARPGESSAHQSPEGAPHVSAAADAARAARRTLDSLTDSGASCTSVSSGSSRRNCGDRRSERESIRRGAAQHTPHLSGDAQGDALGADDQVAHVVGACVERRERARGATSVACPRRTLHCRQPDGDQQLVARRAGGVSAHDARHLVLRRNLRAGLSRRCSGRGRLLGRSGWRGGRVLARRPVHALPVLLPHGRSQAAAQRAVPKPQATPAVSANAAHATQSKRAAVWTGA